MPSAAPSGSFGHIDIAFEITEYGLAQRIDIVDATSKTVQELQRLNLSAGVDIQIKL